MGGQGRILRVGGCTRYRQAPQGLTSGAQGRLVREIVALGCLFTSHLPRVPGAVPFKPWHGFSTLEVLGGELACWDPSSTGASPGWPRSWNQDPQGLGVGDRGQTPSPSSQPTDPAAPRTAAWEPQGRMVSGHHCAQT